jgi:AraC-like DNA-binding protein
MPATADTPPVTPSLLATTPPHMPRALLRYLKNHNMDTNRLCGGLGFDADDLDRPDFRLSVMQTSRLVMRALEITNTPGLGLQVGASQTITSWGLVGLAMMASETLGAAVTLGLNYQIESGALLEYRGAFSDERFELIVEPRHTDPKIDIFIIEEAFSCVTKILRSLVGTSVKPLFADFRYADTGYVDLYQDLFDCEISFSAESNRLVFDRCYWDYAIETADHYTLAQLLGLLGEQVSQRSPVSQLESIISKEIRKHLPTVPTLHDVAATILMSERTLRRRLQDIGLSFSNIVETEREKVACQLLLQHKSIQSVSLLTGFSSEQSFRKAFRRWTGVSPSEFRIASLK